MAIQLTVHNSDVVAEPRSAQDVFSEDAIDDNDRCGPEQELTAYSIFFFFFVVKPHSTATHHLLLQLRQSSI